MAGTAQISGETLKQYADSLKAISHQVRQGIYCKDLNDRCGFVRMEIKSGE